MRLACAIPTGSVKQTEQLSNVTVYPSEQIPCEQRHPLSVMTWTVVPASEGPMMNGPASVALQMEQQTCLQARAAPNTEASAAQEEKPIINSATGRERLSAGAGNMGPISLRRLLLTFRSRREEPM